MLSYNNLFVLLVGAFLLFLIILELISRSGYCPPRPTGDYSLFTEYQPTERAITILSQLRQKRATGEKISKAEYREALQEVTIEVKHQRLGGLFGVADSLGGKIAFVRDNMPDEIKLVVKRHELEHLLQTKQEPTFEFRANWATFKEYPGASLKMILYAIKDRAKFYRHSPICFLVNLWQSFKQYLLPL